MAEVSLQAEVRNARGKGPARRLRAAGSVPGTLYGRGLDAVAVAVDRRRLVQTLSTDAGANVLIDLHVDGQTHLTLAREIARDPIRGDILHVDFLRIARDQKITVDVPIHLEGESHGVKEGGVIEHHLWQLGIECLPGDVPERVRVDVSALGIGDSLHVRDLAPPERCVILTSEDEIVVSCVVPQVLKIEEEVPAEVVPAEGEAPVEGEAPEAAAEGAGEKEPGA